VLSLPPSVRVFLCLRPSDMRRSFDSLAHMAEEVVRQDPLSGHLFVFRNKRADRVKILYWDRDGYAIWYKRLEEGVFHFPESDESGLEIESTRLAMLLGGIDLAGARNRRRFALRGAEKSDAAAKKERIFVDK
jgi:transposase